MFKVSEHVGLHDVDGVKKNVAPEGRRPEVDKETPSDNPAVRVTLIVLVTDCP